MIANKNDYMASAAETMYISSEEANIIKVAREREDFLAWKAAMTKEIAELTTENKEQADRIAHLERLLAENGIKS